MDFEKRYNTEIKRFGERIRQLRSEQGLTQTDLEIRTSIDRSDISKIEQGKANVEFFTIVKFAEALEVRLAELFHEENKQVEKGKRKK